MESFTRGNEQVVMLGGDEMKDPRKIIEVVGLVAITSKEYALGIMKIQNPMGLMAMGMLFTSVFQNEDAKTIAKAKELHPEEFDEGVKRINEMFAISIGFDGFEIISEEDVNGPNADLEFSDHLKTRFDEVIEDIRKTIANNASVVGQLIIRGVTTGTIRVSSVEDDDVSTVILNTEDDMQDTISRAAESMGIPTDKLFKECSCPSCIAKRANRSGSNADVEANDALGAILRNSSDDKMVQG